MYKKHWEETVAGQRMSAKETVLQAAQDTFEFTQQKECGNMRPRPHLKVAFVIGSQMGPHCAYGLFTPEPKAGHLWSDHSGRMLTSGLTNAES